MHRTKSFLIYFPPTTPSPSIAAAHTSSDRRRLLSRAAESIRIPITPCRPRLRSRGADFVTAVWQEPDTIYSPFGPSGALAKLPHSLRPPYWIREAVRLFRYTLNTGIRNRARRLIIVVIPSS